MARKKIVCIVLFFIAWRSTDLFAEVAILPYKVMNPSTHLSLSLGEDYARVLSIAAQFKKKIDVTSPRDIELDMKRLKINPQGRITQDDLDILAGGMRIDFILTGKISRVQNYFISDSVFYSSREKRIVLKTRNKSDNLLKLAVKDINEIFIQYGDSTTETHGRSLDAVLLIDASYKINSDWEQIKNGIISFASKAIDTAGKDTRINIITFSDSTKIITSAESRNSIQSLRKGLDAVKPFGGTDGAIFKKALQYAVNNTVWRDGSEKIIILFVNSDLCEARLVEQFGISARKKGAPIYAFSFGSLKSSQCDIPKRLASISKGEHHNVSYHQRVFDVQGDAVELYMQNGRLFTTRTLYQPWTDGLTDHYSGHDKPREPFEEIFFDSQKIKMNPYNMFTLYPKIKDPLISKEPLENNIAGLLASAKGSGAAAVQSAGESTEPIGKALITEGNISFWVTVTREDIMNALETRNSIGDFFYLGVTIKSDSERTYGLSVQPVLYGLSAQDIPEIMQVKLRDLIKDKERYLTEGLMYPPLWFIYVKVGEIERFRGAKDIREE